jgi:hypothetical protein
MIGAQRNEEHVSSLQMCLLDCMMLISLLFFLSCVLPVQTLRLVGWQDAGRVRGGGEQPGVPGRLACAQLEYGMYVRCTNTNFPVPTDLTTFRGFLELVNQLGHFLPNLAHLTVDLRQLLKKDVDFMWLQPHQEAFELI